MPPSLLPPAPPPEESASRVPLGPEGWMLGVGGAPPQDAVGVMVPGGIRAA